MVRMEEIKYPKKKIIIMEINSGQKRNRRAFKVPESFGL